MDNKKTILIIEPDEIIRFRLMKIFSDNGFGVLMAKDGTEGVRLALQIHPDSILLDFIFPEQDGIKQLQTIRENFWGAHIPVIVLTNMDPTNQMLRAISLYRPAYFLTKNHVNLAEIPMLVENVLEYNPLLDTVENSEISQSI